MKGNLWFKNSQGTERLVAAVDNWDDINHSINQFIEQCNAHKKGKPFKSYYMRLNPEEDGRIQIDVGSWSEFFYTDLPL